MTRGLLSGSPTWCSASQGLGSDFVVVVRLAHRDDLAQTALLHRLRLRPPRQPDRCPDVGTPAK
jgi:hypothetical protein